MKKLNSYKNKPFFKIIFAIFVFFSRFGFFAPNISVLGSYGFFGQNIFLYFLTILVFDFFKGGFYSGFIFTYFGFFSYWLFGKLAKTQKLQIFLLPFASFSFFIISNFGVWWYRYPHSISGLIACYVLAIPFYRNTLIGDLFFGYGFVAIKSVFKLIYANQFFKLKSTRDLVQP
ncbi:MAG: hypothetical protein H6772_02325 [Pseudomonadales bacterium]|nr:hypothetical protein [Pseudomonadales bacterium]